MGGANERAKRCVLFVDTRRYVPYTTRRKARTAAKPPEIGGRCSCTYEERRGYLATTRGCLDTTGNYDVCVELARGEGAVNGKGRRGKPQGRGRGSRAASAGRGTGKGWESSTGKGGSAPPPRTGDRDPQRRGRGVRAPAGESIGPGRPEGETLRTRVREGPAEAQGGRAGPRASLGKNH